MTPYSELGKEELLALKKEKAISLHTEWFLQHI